MKLTLKRLIPLCLLVFAPPIAALESARPNYPAPASALGAGSIVQIILSLLLVLAAIVLVAWMLKRMNVAQKGHANLLKVIGGVAIGQRERVVLLEIGETWLVVGVAPNQIRTLHTLPKATANTEPVATDAAAVPFNAWLKKMIEKRNVS